jgi:pimeloyl-ACP methyl ester carboxylesterase
MCVRGATRPWFADSQSPPFESVFIPRDDLAIHQQIFDPKKGGSGYGPGLNWYKALIANVNVSDESSIPPERHHIEQPTLAIFASGDFFCIPAVNEEMMRPYVKNLKVETVDAGHFFLLQKPDETNKILKEFFDEVQEKTKHLL